MRDDLLEKCERFIRNTEVMKASFSWNSALVNMCAAAAITIEGAELNIMRLKQINQIYNHMSYLFSCFNSAFKPLICSQLYTSNDPQLLLKTSAPIYRLLNTCFCTSYYLPQASFIIAQAGDPSYYRWLTERTKAIFERLKANHHLLTNHSDITYCTMMSFSQRSDDEIIIDMNKCSKYLRKISVSSNVIQSVSCILALCDGTPEEKSDGFISLYNELKRIDHKYGTKYELAALAAFSSSQRPSEEIAIDIADADQWLKGQNFFGFFSTISSKQRRLIAGMLSLDTNVPNTIIKSPFVLPSFFIKQSCICSLMSSISSGTR